MLSFSPRQAAARRAAATSSFAADGALAPGEEWIQESIIGSTFAAHYRWLDQDKGHIKPTIIGAAYITAEAHLRLNPDDPLRWGIPAAGVRGCELDSPAAAS
jgi:4-hydroxyproline epimerase